MHAAPVTTAAASVRRRLAIIGPLPEALEQRPLDDEFALEHLARIDDLGNATGLDAILLTSAAGTSAAITAAQRIRQANPHCLRVLVHADDTQPETRAFDYLHQIMPTSRANATLVPLLLRCFRLREILSQAANGAQVTGLDSLPSLPHVYHEFSRASQSEAMDYATLADIVEHDTALTARILGIANSAQFSKAASVVSIKHAISVLGLEMLASLVTATSLFSVVNDRQSVRRMESVWVHATHVAQLSVRIAEAEQALSRDVRAELIQAAMLHDIGQLVIQTQMPDAECLVAQTGLHDGSALCDMENREIGASHSEIGACLLAYWGVSVRTVEAVALHHDLAAAAASEDPIVAAICGANELLVPTEAPPADNPEERPRHIARLEEHFGTDRVQRWVFESTRFLDD